ncbi:TIGR03089 family protein [Brachybacterium sp. GCM10030267]|uniref:TIGR03089 family protein n=1 Tax=unclassified Brachybacterium TaxID=2623841 RepID=UPI003616C331
MTVDLSTRLLAALERGGPHPVLAWYGEASRIELSGHVLANWVIKAVGHLHDEIALELGDSVLIDLPPHWKRLVLALASWSLGAEVTIADGHGAGPERTGPRVVITDRPESELAADADEVLALEPLSLAPRFSSELPALAHDWVAEVRASSDRLGVALPAWSGPDPVAAAAGDGTASTSAPPRLLVAGDGLESAPAVLAALLAGGGIVGPAAAVSERQAQEESVTGRA